MLANIGGVQLLIILAIVLVIFGGGKIKRLGHDLGGMISGFKKEMKGETLEDFGEDVVKGAKTLRNFRKTADKVKDQF